MIRGREWALGAVALVTLSSGLVAVSHDRPGHATSSLTTLHEPGMEPTMRTEEGPSSAASHPTTPSADTPTPLSTPAPWLPTAPDLPLPLPTSMPSLPPVPIPTELPSILDTCPQDDGARPWPGAQRRLAVEPGRDTSFIGAADGLLWRRWAGSVDGHRSLIATRTDGTTARTLDIGDTGAPIELSQGYFVTRNNNAVRRVATDGSSDRSIPLARADGTRLSARSVSASHGRILVVAYAGTGEPYYLVSFDLVSLTQQWMVEISSTVGSPNPPAAASNGKEIYVLATVGNGLTRTGHQVWRFSLDGIEEEHAELAAGIPENFVPVLVATADGFVIHEGHAGRPAVSSFVSMARSLEVRSRWTAPGAVIDVQIFGDELWTTAIVCGNPFMLTRRDASTFDVRERQMVCERACYGVAPMGGALWMLETRDPGDPVAYLSIPA